MLTTFTHEDTFAFLSRIVAFRLHDVMLNSSQDLPCLGLKSKPLHKQAAK